MKKKRLTSFLSILLLVVYFTVPVDLFWINDSLNRAEKHENKIVSSCSLNHTVLENSKPATLKHAEEKKNRNVPPTHKILKETSTIASGSSLLNLDQLILYPILFDILHYTIWSKSTFS
jgi:hypothetical protein